MSPFYFFGGGYMELKYIKAAYIRGFLIKNNILDNHLVNNDLLSLSDDDLLKLDELGLKHNLKLYYFKEKDELPRVKAVLGFLKNIYPSSLLDVGSGRGVFLFPFIRDFDYCNILSIDILDYRVGLMEYIHIGGINNLNSCICNICNTNIEDNSYDVVTMLEVLEHIPDYKEAIRNALRIAKNYIIVTVPSKKDDNPEHIHLLTKDILSSVFNECGVSNLKFSGVNGHLVLIAKKG